MLQSCATNETDPFEPVNRAVFTLNTKAATLLSASPGGHGSDSTANFLLVGAANFAGNLREPLNFANALLQGRECAAGVSLRRFLANTTLGLGGLADVAKLHGGIPEYHTSFGDTLGLWGLPAGPYLVLPLFGPTNARGVAGTAVEYAVDPVSLAAAQAGSTATDAVITGFQLFGDIVGSGPSQELPTDIQDDPYLAERRAFEGTEAKLQSGYECPDALQRAFWSAHQRPPE